LSNKAYYAQLASTTDGRALIAALVAIELMHGNLAALPQADFLAGRNVIRRALCRWEMTIMSFQAYSIERPDFRSLLRRSAFEQMAATPASITVVVIGGLGIPVA
jgi:hypothetical protein